MTAREALKELRDNLETHLKASPMYSADHCTINSAEVAAMIAEADEVLAKPERNCDRYPTYDTAFAVWRNGTQNSNFGEWLLETADNNP